ncbi:MAG: hypothetical protein R3D63_07955 [Paracoccaceae bacterium]
MAAGSAGGGVRILGWVLTGLGLAALVWQVWTQEPPPPGYLFGMPDRAAEAAYCLAVAERIGEITGGHANAGLERHLDEQIDFWRGRAIGALGKGRAGLARDSGAPGVVEAEYLRVAAEACGMRAITAYRHRFTLPE